MPISDGFLARIDLQTGSRNLQHTGAPHKRILAEPDVAWRLLAKRSSVSK
jgi:hypothetical protein